MTLDENPFYVLGLRPGCARAEVEREGQKLLGMLELGLSKARVYDTPAGPRVRTPELVRHAMAELRDPEKRLTHELWAHLEASERVVAPRDTPSPAARGRAKVNENESDGWSETPSVLGWRAR